MLVMGLLGAIRTASAEVIASMTPGAGSASEAPAKRTEFDRILIPALHEIFLEAQLADIGRVDAGFDARVAHGQNARLHAELFADDGVASESVLPSASNRERSRCMARSRSPV